MPAADPKPRRTATPVVTRLVLADLLNDEFTRQVKAIYACAVFAERLRPGHPRLAAAAERRGREEARHALVLCQVIYDFQASVRPGVDDMNAVLGADRAAAPGWHDESVRRLCDRVRQLRTVGEPGLAKRVARVLSAKRSAGGLERFACPAG